MCVLDVHVLGRRNFEVEEVDLVPYEKGMLQNREQRQETWERPVKRLRAGTSPSSNDGASYTPSCFAWLSLNGGRRQSHQTPLIPGEQPEVLCEEHGSLKVLLRR